MKRLGLTASRSAAAQPCWHDSRLPANQDSCMCGRKLTAQCVALAVSASAAVSFARGVELACAPRASSSSALRAASSALCLHSNNQQQSTICLLECCTIAGQIGRQCV